MLTVKISLFLRLS